MKGWVWNPPLRYKKNVQLGKTMKILFWMSFIWVFYAYAGYMIFLALVVLCKERRVEEKDAEPAVTMIIAAFNEEKAIDGKIINCFGLDYPQEKLEIIIVSDASTDNTDEIIKNFEDKGIVYYRMEERGGKTRAQNHAIPKAKGDILVFSDATTIFKKDAVRKLVRHFNNENTGIVAGEEIFVEKIGSNVHSEVSFSWKYELFLRRLESGFNTLIGVSGCIFAIRKELHEKLDEELIEDFALPLLIAEKGYKVHIEKEAVAYEESVKNAGDEFNRKVRIVRGGMNVVFNLRRLLNPFKHAVLAFQIISHKIFRWLAPVFLMTMFISNIILMEQGLVYGIFLAIQVVIYLFAVIGYFMRYSGVHFKVLRIPFHFCMLNAAALVGGLGFLKGERSAVWETSR